MPKPGLRFDIEEYNHIVKRRLSKPECKYMDLHSTMISFHLRATTKINCIRPSYNVTNLIC
jgi:hypothetical protein